MTPITKLFLAILFGAVLYILPVPSGLEPKAWHLFSIFVATIFGMILKPFPMGFIAIFGLSFACLTNVLSFDQGMSGFANPVIWLVVLVFFIARGFIKTNLGTRLAYIFVRMLGKRSLGLGYGIAFTEFFIAPVMPSNAARTGGVMLPIIKSISEALGSTPNAQTERKLGAFLCQVSYHANLITSAMFLTAMAANPMAQDLALSQNVEITWLNWFFAAIVPGIISLIVVPFVLYLIYPPELKVLPEAKELAQKKLKEMGAMSHQEWMMVCVFAVLLLLWMFGDSINVKAGTAALVGLCLMLGFKIIDWKDVLAETEAWHTFTWLAILVTMSTFLKTYGFIGWFSGCIENFVSDWSWHAAFLTLALAYFYSHYFFASNTAHVSSMYAAFLAVSISVGTPPLLAALVLAFFSSLFSSMTHYGTSSGAVIFGANYVTLPDWWYNGIIISVINVFIWLGIGGLWWKIIGIW